MPEENLNGDLARRVWVDTAQMPWSPSPSPTVWRKRVHRVGPAEAGQVTSVVRYDAGSDFPVHEHPDGEEILVLDGIFTDDRGDWPAGTYLLNPEGYRHAPSSREGCVLFVKLRQYPGRDRRQVAVNTLTIPWERGIDGIDRKLLYLQKGYTDCMTLERWAAGASPGPRRFAGGAEIFVLSGDLSDDVGSHAAGTWMRLPAGAALDARSASGCELYIKSGGHGYLLSEQT